MSELWLRGPLPDLDPMLRPARLPATVLGILFHAGEHTTRHVGQLITTVAVVRGLGLAPSPGARTGTPEP